jgi:hypothetical protein
MNLSQMCLNRVQWRTLVRTAISHRLLLPVLVGHLLSDISGSHGGEYEDGCLLDCCAVLSETSVYFYQTTRRNNPSSSHLQSLIS